ncbi:MAG TPA: PduL/EutD family phosphate acyltransferase, partial [Casimicrobiaceae bacterium]
KHGDQVEVAVDSNGRDLVFRDVVIRTDPRFVTEMHIDTDEANAAHLKHGGAGELAPVEGCAARITRCHVAAAEADKSCCLDEPGGDAARNDAPERAFSALHGA